MTDKTARTRMRYDVAAPRWRDKMRALGYYDAYLGFLSSQDIGPNREVSVTDIGAGTAAFAEAWVALNGLPKNLTLIEPSRTMLEIGRSALNSRGVDPSIVLAKLAEADLEPSDEILAAHVIEHCPDPFVALQQIYALLRPGGRLHLAVSKPHWCNAIIWLQWRHRTFHDDEILSLLNKAGFETKHVYAFPTGPPSRTSRGIVAARGN